MKRTIAVILALVMCMSVGMMAFAEAPSYDEDDAVVASGTSVLDKAGDADTYVDILVNANNISVTVPLRFAIVADVAGGDCYTPEYPTYYIQNNSSIPVKVTAADVVNGDNNDEWTLVENATQGTVLDVNEISMTLKPDNGTEWNLAADYTPDWSIAAATTSGKGILNIDIAAKSSMLNTTDEELDAFIITYTFAAA